MSSVAGRSHSPASSLPSIKSAKITCRRTASTDPLRSAASSKSPPARCQAHRWWCSGHLCLILHVVVVGRPNHSNRVFVTTHARRGPRILPISITCPRTAATLSLRSVSLPIFFHYGVCIGARLRANHLERDPYAVDMAIVSPHRGKALRSRSKRSSARPTVWVTISSMDAGFA